MAKPAFFTRTRALLSASLKSGDLIPTQINSHVKFLDIFGHETSKVSLFQALFKRVHSHYCVAAPELLDRRVSYNGGLLGTHVSELPSQMRSVPFLGMHPRSFAALAYRTTQSTKARRRVSGSTRRVVGEKLGTGRRFVVKRRDDAPVSSNRSSLVARREGQAKRKSRQLDALGRVRSSSLSGQRVNRSDVARSRNFDRPNQRRREFEADHAEPQPKRRRRLMRLHPRDQTSKRIVEDTTVCPPPATKKKSVEVAMPKEDNKEIPELSRNAQFRAIQPSSELLRHIETQLLGRRRLLEWRKGGYHPKLKAPLDDVPHGNKEGRLPIQETVFKRKLTFIAAAKVSSSLPTQQLPEIAFAGRSNVGKSSLINALTRQWGVVRTSDKPGLTQSINFFTLGARLCLVDLPGYGFAYAKEESKEAWDDLVKEYTTTRRSLKRVCLLVDAKWGLKPRDEELLHLMENAETKYQIVLTKTDVLPPIDLARRATQIQEALRHRRSLVLPVMMVSSHTGGGIPNLRRVLSGLAIPIAES